MSGDERATRILHCSQTLHVFDGADVQCQCGQTTRIVTGAAPRGAPPLEDFASIHAEALRRLQAFHWPEPEKPHDIAVLAATLALDVVRENAENIRQGARPTQGMEGYCPYCYHPFDSCKHCRDREPADAPSAPPSTLTREDRD